MPAFSLTGHKTQGATLKNVLIASYSGHSSGKDGWLYVVISRIKSLENPYTVDKLPEKLHHYKPREKVISEDNRLKRKAKILEKRAEKFWEKKQGFFR